MNLKHVSDEQLLRQTEALAREERELLTRVLHHLKEIETRRLFSALKYKSLFEYAIKHLKYSSDQAGRRIAAMRLLKDLPEIENQIDDGSLTLTNLSLAQGLFRDESFSKSDKLQIVKQLENLSSREAERLVLSRSRDPIKLKPDSIRAVTPEHVEIKFIANDELIFKLEKLRGLLGHKLPYASMGDLIRLTVDIAIEQLKPRKPIREFGSKPNPEVQETDTSETSADPEDALWAPNRQCGKTPGKKSAPKRHSIPASTKRQVWQRANHQCENCASVHALEIDHIVPLAEGGTDQLSNLRLLCRSCNQRAAIEKLGMEYMRPFLESRKDI